MSQEDKKKFYTMLILFSNDTMHDRTRLLHTYPQELVEEAVEKHYMPVYHSNMFEELSAEEKLEFFQKIYEIDRINGYYTGIMTDTVITDTEFMQDLSLTYTGTHSIAAGWRLEPEWCPTNSDSDFTEYFYHTRGKSGSSSSSISSDEECYFCNGTGVVRYNYGSSDLEAILSGHDPYTYGQCASCGGIGRAK